MSIHAVTKSQRRLYNSFDTSTSARLIEIPRSGTVEERGIIVHGSQAPGDIRNVDLRPGEVTEAIVDVAGYVKQQRLQLRDGGVVD
jgi:hypothetical protein